MTVGGTHDVRRPASPRRSVSWLAVLRHSRGLDCLGCCAVVDGLLFGGVVPADDVVDPADYCFIALLGHEGLVVLPTVVAVCGVPHAGVGVEVAVGRSR